MSEKGKGRTLDILDELDRKILERYPYPVAIYYQRILEEQDWEKKTRACVWTFDMGLRLITLALTSQYVVRDIDEISDPEINRLLLAEFSKGISLGTWANIFFKLLNVYKGHRKRFFVPGIYDFYWNTSRTPHIPVANVRAPFERLVQIRNGLAHQPAGNWHLLFDEAFGLLKKVLKEFDFITKYDLVHMTKRDNRLCQLEVYSGVEIKVQDISEEKANQLEDDWFYLSRQNRLFLPLHPLLIQWERDNRLSEDEKGLIKDTGLFDQFRRSSIEYILSILGEKVRIKDKSIIEDFVETVFKSIERAKDREKSTRRLVWDQLREMAFDTSRRRMSSVLNKYNPSLYLQRNQVLGNFDDFLQSDKICFVLTGRSGIGKTNFLLALLDEYQTEKADVCLLLYNGARLSAEQNIGTLIAQDLMAYMQQEKMKGFSISDPWREINRIDGVEDKKVVLFIEALNENPDAKGLLRQIDELVENALWPWLKVVIVARTEAWRVIKRGSQISEARYYRSGSDNERIGIEMQPFTYSEEIKPFTSDELRVVYEKYRTFYKLQTEYEKLPVDVKIAFRDPLVLRLVADTNQEGEIPSYIDVNELYGDYVDNLIETGRLTKDDVYFLEQEIMPLMLDGERLSNRIAEQQIREMKTRRGKSLFDEMFGQRGRQPSQTYLNLADAEILAQQGSETSYEIVFKYERFYDYFAARRLQSLLEVEENILTKYQELITRLNEFPFMWGAMRKVLLDGMSEDSSMITALMYLRGQVVRKMMGEVLMELGKSKGEGKKVVENILHQVVRRNANRNPLVGTDLSSAKIISVDVAVELGLIEILGITAGDRNATLRTHTAIAASECWGVNYELGHRLLDEMTKRLTYVLIFMKLPRLRVFETLVSTVFMIFFRNYHDSRSTKPLADAIQRVYTTIIPVNPNSGFGRSVSDLAFRILFSIVFSLMDKTTTEKVQYIPANLHEINIYFTRPQVDRDLMLEILKIFYIDSSEIENYRDVFERVIELDDGDINWAVVHLMARHGLKNPEGTTRVLVEMFEKQVSKERPSYHAAFLLGAFAYYIERLNSDHNVSELFHLYEQMIKSYVEKTKCRVY